VAVLAVQVAPVTETQQAVVAEPADMAAQGVVVVVLQVEYGYQVPTAQAQAAHMAVTTAQAVRHNLVAEQDYLVKH
jgi:hypothetical protein